MKLATVLEDACEREWQTVAPDTVKPVRFAVLGLGWFTRGRALPAMVESKYCEATVLVSGTREKAERLAAETSGAERGITYDDFHEGVASDAFDAVYIVTPNATHLEFAQTAASFEKAVLCEKPLERDSERARQLINVCDDADVPLMVAYRMHTEPAIRRARALIHDGVVGEPQAVHGEMSQRLLDRIDPNPDQWRLDRNLAGGGALFDLGVYPLNTARFLLDTDPAAVVGRTKSTHEAFDEVDETASLSVAFPDDVVATCFVSHNARQASNISVTGTKGRVAIEPAFFQDQARTLHISRGDGRASIDIDPVDQMLEEFDYFAHQLRTDGTFDADGRHGLIDIKTLEALYESDRTGSWVNIE